MHMMLGEVVPPPALAIPIITILGWGVVSVVCFFAIRFAQAFAGIVGGTIGKLPIIGGWVNSGIHNVARKVTGALGPIASSADAQVGGAFHSLARIVDHVGHEIESHANLFTLLGTVLLGSVTGADFWQQIGTLHRSHATTTKQIGALHRHQSETDRRQARGIGADVLPRIKSLEREVHGEVVRERVRARAAERTVDREITNLWKWTRTHTLTAGTVAFTGAVAYALTRLQLRWLRCPSLGRLGNRIGCGGFGALEDLLFGLVTAVAATDLCDLANAAGGVAHAIRPALMELVDVENALVGCHGATAPPSLDLAHPRLPPVRSPLQLTA